jgi:hypothetical protein
MVMWKIVTKLERKIVGTAETLKDVARAIREAKLAGVECDAVFVKGDK